MTRIGSFAAIPAASLAALLSASIAGLLAACSGSATHPNNAAALTDIQARRSGDEVVVEGMVTRVYRPSSGDSGIHEHFDIRIASGVAEQDIAVADNITIGAPAPVQRGDDVIVKGVLEIDPSGPIIHWTHHDPQFRHPGGFVIVHGNMYD